MRVIAWLLGYGRQLKRLEKRNVKTQQDVDALAARITKVNQTAKDMKDAVTTGVEAMRTEIADLKTQIANGTPPTELDFTGVDNAVTTLETSVPAIDDDLNPPATGDTTTDPTANPTPSETVPAPDGGDSTPVTADSAS